MALHLAKQCAEELASLAEKLLDKVPDQEEWRTVRRFLQDTVRLLRRGDVLAGMSAFQRILPYVEKALNNVDRYVKVSDAFHLTETLTEHFLVDDDTKANIEKYLAQTKLKMIALKVDIERFSLELDEILAGVMKGAEPIGFYMAVKLAFHMNRIAGQICSCEDRLKTARRMLDDLDTHVAGKNIVATLMSYVFFLGSIVLSASGNLPAGAACLATATATRRSSQGLAEYRRQLSQIDRDHRELQSELSEWRFRFRAEQRNFLLLAGIKYFVLLLTLVAICFFVLGKAANFIFFSLISIFVVVKAEETNHVRYYAVVVMAIVAIVMEIQAYSGLVMFNTCSAIFLTVQFLGFLEII